MRTVSFVAASGQIWDRIVNVTSGTASLSRMCDPDHYFAKFPGWLGYPVSKTALNQVTVQYAKQLRGEGIAVNAADPGPTATGLISSSPSESRSAAPAGRAPEEGARIIVELATGIRPGSGQYLRETGPVPW